MLVEKLRPWVTSFSAHIEQNALSGDEVSVGGKVISFLDMSSILSDSGEGVYLTLDDGVGTIDVAVPKQVYDKYKEATSFDIGSIILATGRLHRMPMERKGKKIKKHPEETIRVLCWKIGNLPEEEKLEVGSVE